MLNKLRNKPSFRRDVALLVAANTLWALGHSMYQSLLPVYIKEFTESTRIVGFIMSIGYITGILTIIGGWLSTKINTKYLVIWAWLITVPAPFIFMLAGSWQMVMIGQFLHALTAIGAPSISLYVFDYPFDGEKMGPYMMVNMGSMICSIFAPSIGGLLAERYGMRLVFGIAFVIYALSTALTFFLTRYRQPSEEKTEKKKGSGFSEIGKPVFIFIGFMCILHFAQSIAEPIVSLYLKEVRLFSIDAVGYAFTALGVGGVLVTAAIKRYDARIGTGKLLIILMTLFIAANLGMGAMATAVLMLAMVLRGVGKAMFGFSQGKVTEIVPGAGKGIVVSLYMSARSLTMAIGSNLGAGLYEIHSYLPFLIEIAVLAIWLGAFALCDRKFDFFTRQTKNAE